MAAVEEEWSSRLNSSLALNQDLEARVAELQKQGSRMRRSVCLHTPVITQVLCGCGIIKDQKQPALKRA